VSLAKLWEPLAEVLHKCASDFESGEIVAIEFCEWSHKHLKYAPTMTVGRADMEFASGFSIPIFLVRATGPIDAPSLLDPTKAEFSDDEEWASLMIPVDPASLFAEISGTLATLTNRYHLDKKAKFYVDESEEVESQLLESGLFVMHEGGKFSPIKPEVLRREPRYRIGLE
jgi:hypothetical protein